MKRLIGYLVAWLFAAGTVVAGATPAAAAESAADFFKGKTITYIVASGRNGSADIYGRLAAKYMEKYIPGSTFVVVNVDSPRQVAGANRIYAAKPDGLTIGIFTPRQRTPNTGACRPSRRSPRSSSLPTPVWSCSWE